MAYPPRWLRVVRARCASARRYREFLEKVYQERMRRLSGVELELYEYSKMLYNISVNMAERENEQGRREKDLERREKDMERRERKALAAITSIKKKKVMRRQRRHHHRRLRVGSSRPRLRAGTVTTMQLDYDVEEEEEGEEEVEADVTTVMRERRTLASGAPPRSAGVRWPPVICLGAW